MDGEYPRGMEHSGIHRLCHIDADGISLDGVKALDRRSDGEKYLSPVSYLNHGIFYWPILEQYWKVFHIHRNKRTHVLAWNVFGIRPNQTLVNVFYMKAFRRMPSKLLKPFDRYRYWPNSKSCYQEETWFRFHVTYLPPLDLQQRFAKIVSSVEEQKAKMRKHLEQLDDLFASLQQRAFRGDL